MSLFRSLLAAAPAAAALLLSACGGGAGSATAGTTQLAGSQTVVGAPSQLPQVHAVVLDDFVAAAKGAACAGFKNNLYVIDKQQVLWERAGDCPDNSYELVLYGANPQTVLCSQASTIAGLQSSCKDESFRAMFQTVAANLDKRDLGLGAAHTVELTSLVSADPVPVEAKAVTLMADTTSAVTDKQNVTIRDAQALERLWNAHFAGRTAPALPQVDFATQTVVAIFAGQQAQGCTGVSVVKTVAVGRQLEVDYQVAPLPTFAVCTEAKGSPAVFAAVPRTDSAISFVNTTPGYSDAFTVIEKTMNSGITEQKQVIIKDAAAWQDLWAKHSPGSAAPKVDFGSKMVIAAFRGATDTCHSVTLSEVHHANGQLQVTLTNVVPPIGVMCIMLAASPAYMIEVERTDDPVVFTEQYATL